MSTSSSIVSLTPQILPDKEYRKGVHWLETLRLRRTKILEAAYTVSVLQASTKLDLHLQIELGRFYLRISRHGQESVGDVY